MPSTKAKSLTERTGEALYDMILIQKQFKPGDKLPNEFELSARLGVSRATLKGSRERADSAGGSGGQARQRHIHRQRTA